MPTPAKPRPLPDEHSERYWDALSTGRLLIQRCQACRAHQFYPRRHCIRCFAPDPDWVEARGTGRLHTFSVLHRSANPEFAGDCPYVLGIVELDEGVRVTARIDVPIPALACDLPLQLAHAQPGTTPPCFELQETPA